MITKADLFIIICLILISMALFLVFGLGYSGRDQVLKIYSENKLYAEYDLLSIKGPFELKVDNQYGNLTVYISQDEVCVIDSDCEDKLCTGYSINKINQIITCVPNRVLIEIKNSKKKSDVDMVVY